jgi:ornithine carbamoyltransferase
MFDGIEYRGAAQATVEALGAYADVPVWNGLTDEWHPTQMLADIMTMRDNTRKRLTAVSYCYLGDGRNNVANSLLVTGRCSAWTCGSARPGRCSRRSGSRRSPASSRPIRAPG